MLGNGKLMYVLSEVENGYWQCAIYLSIVEITFTNYYIYILVLYSERVSRRIESTKLAITMHI